MSLQTDFGKSGSFATELQSVDLLAALTAASDGLAIWDSNRAKLVWMNDKLRSRLGLAASSALPEFPVDVELGTESPIVEYSAATGEPVAMQCQMTRFGDGNWLILHKDISAHCRLEEKLLSLMARKSAVEEEFEQFLYATSHDLQEPLRNISEFSKLLRAETEGSVNEEAQLCLDYIGKSTSRAQAMIAGLLELSRTRRHMKSIGTVNVRSCVQAVVDKTIPAQSEVEIEVDLSAELSVQTDPALLTLILTKLIENATRYRKPTGQHVIKISGKQDRSGPSLAVHDNGIGFEPHFEKDVFRPFRRLVPRSRVEGVGIGLSVAHAATKLLGGSLTAAGSVGMGASFTLYLPEKHC